MTGNGRWLVVFDYCGPRATMLPRGVVAAQKFETHCGGGRGWRGRSVEFALYGDRR